MNRQSSSPLLSIVDIGVIACIAALLWFTYAEYASSKQELENRSAELTKSLALVPQIKTLRAKPDQATLASHSARALAKAIEQSAAKAKISAEQIASIEPQTPRRTGDTAYMEHTTMVQLEGITLAQFAQLASQLRQLDASLGQLHITALRIDAPYQKTPENNASELWNVEFTLTYFVYSPKSSSSRAG